MSEQRPAIGICTALERARWGVWEQRAALLPFGYITAIQRAGGLVIMIPPDPALIDDPDEMLDRIDGLILAGGADIDPSSYGAEPHPATNGTVPERDRAEIALARRAIERDMPVLGICRGMQLINVALGGTLRQHVPDLVGHEQHRRNPGSFENSDHDVRLAAGLARRARGRRGAARDEVPPSPGRRADRRGPHRHRRLDPRRSPGGDRDRRAAGSCSASSGTPRPTRRAG